VSNATEQSNKPVITNPGLTSGMGVGSQVPVSVKNNGTYTHDLPNSGHAGASKAADPVLPENPGPREPKGQSKVMSSKLDSPRPFLSSTGGSEGERA
jgi:hypothetical protein